MKKLALSAAMTLVGFHAIAGGMNAAIEEPNVTVATIEQDAASSDGGILVPIAALIMFAAGLTN